MRIFPVGPEDEDELELYNVGPTSPGYRNAGELSRRLSFHICKIGIWIIPISYGSQKG